MTTITKEGIRRLAFDEKRLCYFLEEVGKPYPHLDIVDLADTVARDIATRNTYTAEQITNQIILRALERIDETEPDWTYIASRVYLNSLYKEAARNRGYDAKDLYGSFYGLLKTLCDKGIYKSELLLQYSKEEIERIGELIVPERDHLFTYIGLRTVADRYLLKDYDDAVFELPQERFLVIAMDLMREEDPSKRFRLIQESYWAYSNQYMTVATPTLSNAGRKTGGQLSSCFIDTVEDSLDGIMGNNFDVARLSKGGGGLGVYLGKVRARGSSIQNYQARSSGIIPWMKQLNTTAVNVDQLGQRKGAVSVYLDIWHKDIPDFLDAKLNNGDERMRTHDLFPGVCVPDLFMEQVEKRGDWYLFDPHELYNVMGFRLEDSYDEQVTHNEDGSRTISGSFRDKYRACVDNPLLSRTRVAAIDIMKRILISRLETGTPFMFFRDEVNRKNANKQAGMIYCTNLCTEITQNQSATTIESEYTQDGKIITVKTPGDFVVCNLSSISLARAVMDGVLERLIAIQVRMLDNVIDLNNISVLQAQMTNQKYRGIGLGTFGWHHLLALKNIHWETEEAVQYSDELYEQIAYLTIQASVALAKEKGTYPAFEGSDWQTGDYFTIRGYETKENGLDWDKLKEECQTFGVRNGYMMAVAPNSSTSILNGSTASIDPIFRLSYSEEKKDYKIPVTAPDLNHRTYDVYRKTAYKLDQFWSIKQNAARQKHIDQAISFNLYVPNNIKAKILLELHMDAWKKSVKTIYYLRSLSGQDIEECEWCAS